MTRRPMRQRELITLLGGAAAAWPLAARAQQPAMPVVGFLRTGLPETDANVVSAFRKGLSENGFAEGLNLSIEYRWARNNFDLLPALVDELVRRRVAVIAASGIRFALEAKAATTSIPIVFETGGDPVQDGLVASFNRPGGNVTGVTAISRELEAKKLALLCELVPGAVRIGLLTDLNSLTPAANESRITAARTAAATIGRKIEILPASTSREIDGAFARLAQERLDALMVTASQLFYGNRVQIATLAARLAVPTMYWDRPMSAACAECWRDRSPDEIEAQALRLMQKLLRGAQWQR